MQTFSNFEVPALREISVRVAALGGINLGQGTCQLPAPELVVQAACEAAKNGLNRYAPPQGVPALREAIAKKLRSFNKIECDAAHLLVTNGSTGALEVICDAMLKPGDEVILFRPYYPYHISMFIRKEVCFKFVDLRADLSFDLTQLEAAISERTRFMLVNTPHNPTGKVFSASELASILDLCKRHKLGCISDEVYEYITFDQHTHVSMASLPGAFDHTITVGSYSKTFAITGWRIGYLACASSLIDDLRNYSDQIYVCAPTPLQYGVAAGIEQLGEEYYHGRLAEYRSKRAVLCQALAEAGLEPQTPQGAYYVMANTNLRFPKLSSEQVADILIEKVQIGAVPASDFLGHEVRGSALQSNFLRFCFALPDELLGKACASLRAL